MDMINFSKHGAAGIIHLNRPRQLNSLNQDMIIAMTKALQSWRDDDQVKFIVIEGEGRAFCAGGDVVAVYHNGQGHKDNQSFFLNEYALNYLIGTYNKPYISLLDGIVMGGGAGISIHGSHRIVTQNTLFAMPETTIGHFPDVGASHFLPPLASHFGLYLALTGARIQWGDCLQLGLATHAIDAAQIAEFREQLFVSGNVDATLAKFAKQIDFETSADKRQLIDDCFSAASVEECIARLETKANAGNADAVNILEQFKNRSPTSLKVTWAQMTRYASRDLAQVMKTETRIATHIMQNHDFFEGVRALLVDKDKKFNWQPAKLQDVSEIMVESYFLPIEKELEIHG